MHRVVCCTLICSHPYIITCNTMCMLYFIISGHIAHCVVWIGLLVRVTPSLTGVHVSKYMSFSPALTGLPKQLRLMH